MGFKRVGRDTASLFQNIENIGKIVKVECSGFDSSNINNSRSQSFSHNLGVAPSSVIILRQSPASNYVGGWSAGTNYTSVQIFLFNGIFYQVLVNHTSSANINTDYAANKIITYPMPKLYVTGWDDKRFTVVNTDGYSYNIEVLIVR